MRRIVATASVVVAVCAGLTAVPAGIANAEPCYSVQARITAWNSEATFYNYDVAHEKTAAKRAERLSQKRTSESNALAGRRMLLEMRKTELASAASSCDPTNGFAANPTPTATPYIPPVVIPSFVTLDSAP